MKVKEINFALEGTLLPPPAGTCQRCAREHEPMLPHDQESLFWKYWFYRQSGGRWPTWHDAMAHCAPEVRDRWIEALAQHGIRVEPAI